MVRIKICGITTMEDAKAAAIMGVDALGFNFWPPSPRYIPPPKAREIIAALPPFISTVGVFVNEPIDSLCRITDHCSLDLIQLHGDEQPQISSKFPGRIIKAFRLKNKQDIERIGHWKVRALLVDAYKPGVPGGTGELGNWELAIEAKRFGRVILSGGLTPENVTAAISRVQPYAVDVCSGVEEVPGKKDHKKIAALVSAVYAANPICL